MSQQPHPTTLTMIGGEGGGPFSLTGDKNGASLEKICVWVGKSQVKAVKVCLSDDRSQTFGKPSGSNQEYIFQTGECFTALSLWANGDGSRLGAIKFKTNMGGSFFAKMKSELKKEYPIDVGSGYCLGVEGRSGSDIDRMGFMFLNAVESTVLTNVNYPTINQLIRDVAMEDIKSMRFSNNSHVNQLHIIESSKKVTEKSSWSMSTSFIATFSVDVKAGIPKVVEVSDGYSVIIGVEGTYRQDQIVDRNESFSTTIDVPPKKEIDVYITIGKAIFDLPYTGTVKITCKNNSVLQYDTQGRYNGVSYSDITVKMTESDVAEKDLSD